MTTPLRKPIATQLRSLSSSGGLVALLAALGMACGGSSLRAADATWNADADGNWATNTNPPWSTGLAPGGTVGTTDVATFGSVVLTAARTITVDTGRTIGGITFDGTNTSTFGYILSGGSLILTSGGTIQTAGSTGAHTDTISTGITIAGDASTYTFGANSTLNTRLLSISGTVAGASTTTATTLNLSGANTGNNTISGVIGGTTAEARNITISKSGAGKWILSGSNTFTGPVSISGGTLSVTSDSNLGTGTGAGNIALSGGGTLQVTGNGAIINANRGMTLGSSGGTIETTHSNGAQYAGLVTGSGPLTLKNSIGLFTFGNANSDYSGGTTIAAGSRIGLYAGVSSTGSGASVTKGPWGTGTVIWNTALFRTSSTGDTTTTIGNTMTLQGDMTRSSAGGNNKVVNFSGPVTITGGNRTITNAEGGTGNSIIFSGAIGDGGNGLGLTVIANANVIQFSGANTYTGNTTIDAGTFVLASTGSLLLKIQDSSSTQIFGDVTNANANFDGKFRLDLSGVTVSTGTWNLVDVADLTETFGGTFAVEDNSGGLTFSETGNVWKSNNDLWLFYEGTGNLVLVPEPSAVTLLLGGMLSLLYLKKRHRKLEQA